MLAGCRQRQASRPAVDQADSQVARPAMLPRVARLVGALRTRRMGSAPELPNARFPRAGAPLFV
jgi:hypothetical protein